MLTIRTVEQIKAGSRITLFNGIYAIVIGFLYMIFMNFLIRANFRAIDVVWQVFNKYNPAISSIIIHLSILKALFVIGFGITILTYSLYILKKKEKTAWVTLFIVGLIFWASLLAIEVLNKNLYAIIAGLIGWIMFIVGMIIPVKYYLERQYTDY